MIMDVSLIHYKKGESMKNFFVTALIVIVLALLTNCGGSDSEPGKGTAPTILDFSAVQTNSDGEYIYDSIIPDQGDYQFMVQVTDPDSDIQYLEISYYYNGNLFDGPNLLILESLETTDIYYNLNLLKADFSYWDRFNIEATVVDRNGNRSDVFHYFIRKKHEEN